MNTSDLKSLTLTSAVTLIGKRKLSPVELTEALIERIDQTEDKIKAYTTVFREDALRKAEIAEKRLKEKKRIGPLHGIPITVKDLIKTKGIRTTAGSKILTNNVPDIDATVVRLLKRAGAFVFGKSNTHEFALGVTTPPTRNPWNPDLIPGGSSGGSAAAISGSSAIASLGSDTGGSIRIPGSFCGVVGLKPTYGRVSKFGVYPESWSLDHVGPISKTVEDAALMMNVISGFDPLDPNSSMVGVPDFLASLKGRIKGIRIGVPKNYFFDHVDSQVSACVESAIEELKKLGAILIPFEFPKIKEIMAAYTAIDSSEVSSFHEYYYRTHKELYEPYSRSYIELGFLVPATQYLKAQRSRALLANEVLSLFEKFDVIVTPTQPIVAQSPDTLKTKFGDGFEEQVLFSTIRFVAPFNLTGQPAITLNCGFSSSSLPVGIQIVGKLFDEATVLRVAYAYEQATEWHGMNPPI